MSKYRTRFLIILMFILLSVSLIGSSSWLIVHRTNQKIETALDDTNPCFTSEVYYDGKEHEPVLNDLGVQVYGADFDYNVEYLGGTYRDGGGLAEFLGHEKVVAGTHYYKITDKTTGQIICERHAMTIKPDIFTVTSVSTPSASFVGDTVTFNITVSSMHSSGEITSDPFTASYTSKIADYVPSTSLGCAASASTTVDVSDKITLTGMQTNNFDTETPVEYTLNLTLLPTCYSTTTASSTPVYYGNIDQALSVTATNNAPGTTVVAMQSFNHSSNSKPYTAATLVAENHYSHEITQNAMIGSNVTLNIPYDSNGNVLNREGTSDYSPSCTNLVVLGEAVAIENNGVICVGGILGTQNASYPAGVTTSTFAILSMGTGSSISNKSTGKIQAYGYITDPTNTATITSESGSSLTLPYVVYDYGGGSHTTGAYLKGGITPLNVYDMPNVHATLTCKSGSTIYGYASMYASGEMNKTQVTILASSGDALLLLSSGEAVFKHTPYQGEAFGTDIANSKAHIESKTKITFKGNITTGSLKLSLSLGEADMSKVICPVCHKFDINFSGGATYNITSDYKLLPGAKLTVDSGATLNIQKKLLIYSDNIYSATYNGQPVTTASSMWAENSTPRAAAELCVNGTLNVTGGIAGKITTGKTGAKLNLSNASTLSVSSDEGNGTGMYSYTKIYTESSEANGVLGMSAGKAVNANMAKANYYSVNYGNGVYGWAQYSITYDWVYSGTKYSLDNFKNNITNNNPAVYSTTASVVLTIPTLTTTEPYFDGWYTDAACTTPINKIDGLSGNITIYGKWVDEITYDVNFVTNVGCGNVDVTVNTYKMPEGNFNPYNYEIAKSAVNAVRYDATATHYFEGWYTTSDFTTKVSETSGISISSDTTLYAKWITKSKVTITSGSGYVTGINATTDGTTFTVDKSMAANGFYLVPGSTVAITAQYQHSGAASGLVGPATYKAKVEIAANGQTATVGKDSKTSASKYHTVTASATATTNWTISNDTEVTITTANDY